MHNPMPEPPYCTAMIYPGFDGSRHRPPEAAEFCDREAVAGTVYCEQHLWLED